MRPKIFLLSFLFIFSLPFIARLLEAQVSKEKENIYMVIKDTNGEKVEGYLRLYPEDTYLFQT